MEKVKETNPEKLKELCHIAYLKRKEKLEKNNIITSHVILFKNIFFINFIKKYI